VRQYEPTLIAKMLRGMDGALLASVTPYDFQRSPLEHVTPGNVIRELIGNEKERRQR
jgi:hypothetical protein